MSKDLTKEQEVARYNELKKMDGRKLKGAEKEELATLKEKYPELEEDVSDNENKDSEENEKENDEDEEDEDDETGEKPSEKKVETKPKRSPKIVEKNYFTLKGNVLHSGVEFAKGSQIAKDHELVETFQKMGVLE